MDSIDIHREIDRINEAREALHLTYQQLADASLVPLQTVSRVLAHKTENPGYATMLAMQKAVGLTDREIATDLPQVTGGGKSETIDLLRHMLERERLEFKHRLAAEQREYRLRSSYLKRTNRMLAIALSVVMAAVIAVLIIDATNGSIGYFRYFHPIPDWLEKLTGRA